MKRRLLLVCNPTAGAGTGPALAKDLEQRFRGLGHAVELRLTQGRGEAEGIARSRGGEFDVVVAVGGDGTVHELANGLYWGQHSAALAGVGAGTGNDWVRAMGTPHWTQLVEALERCEPLRIDLLRAQWSGPDGEGRRVGVLFAGCGLLGSALEFATPEVKRKFGPRGGYAFGFFRAWMKFPRMQLRVRSPGEGWEARDATTVVVAKSRFSGGGLVQWAPTATYGDGQLHAFWLGRSSRLSALFHFLRLRRGTHTRHPAVGSAVVPWIEIESTPSQALAMDGEMLGSTPVRLEILPRALPVVALTRW